MNQALIDYYRLPKAYANCRLRAKPSEQNGFFRLGPDAVGYGRLYGGLPSNDFRTDPPDVAEEMLSEEDSCYLPYNLAEAADNLRFERYVDGLFNGEGTLKKTLIRNVYYALRPMLPVPLRRHAQRLALKNWDKIPFPGWPVDSSVDTLFEKTLELILRNKKGQRIPFIWFWPEGYQGAMMMTHDVETKLGLDFSPRLAEIDTSFGLQSSFEIVPEERYEVTERLLADITSKGCEICIHGLNHDGHLFDEYSTFLARAKKINRYAKEFRATGFRSPVLYRNLEWFADLEFSYDMSVPNVGHLDPQRGGCCTVMPYFIGDIVELPVTTTQDYSLFHILNKYSTSLWEKQIDLILRKHGLVSFIVHPDYIISERPRHTYWRLLEHLSSIRKESNVWFALPKQIDEWWRLRSRMELTKVDGRWQIRGPHTEQARIAYAKLVDDKIIYEIEQTIENAKKW